MKTKVLQKLKPKAQSLGFNEEELMEKETEEEACKVYKARCLSPNPISLRFSERKLTTV